MKRNLFAGAMRSRGLSVNVFTYPELDEIHLAKRDRGFGERLADDGHDGAHMRPRRQLGHDATVRVMEELRGDDVREERAVAEDGGGGLIAGRFDAEDGHVARCYEFLW